MEMLHFFVICQKSVRFELSLTSGITRSELEAGMDSRISSVHLQTPRTARNQCFFDLRRYASPGPGTANRSRPFKRRSGRGVALAQSLGSSILSLVAPVSILHKIILRAHRFPLPYSISPTLVSTTLKLASVLLYSANMHRFHRMLIRENVPSCLRLRPLHPDIACDEALL